MNDTNSLEYYNKQAREFIDRTVAIDMSSIYERFEKRLSGKVLLDAACGTGRDARYFLKQGYTVTAFDASIEMVKTSSALTGLPVLHMSFSDMNWNQEFDGIWASACLIHCIGNQLHDVIPRFIKALKPGGIWYMSFKKGEGESCDETGRQFLSFNETSLRSLLKDYQEIELAEIWTEPSHFHTDTKWTNGLVVRKYAQ